MKCISGYCKNGTMIFPTDIIEILEVNFEYSEMKIDVDIELIKSKFTEGLLTCISGEDLVKHFVYND